MYQSNITKLIKQLHQNNPDILKKQKESRAIWWNCSLNQKANKINKSNNEKQKPYPYYSL